jgi:uncharacterized protein YukE
MNESYEVVTAALTRHSRTLAELAGELRAALEAAGSVSVTGTAYGQTAQRFAAAASDLASEGQETLRAGVDALEAAANTLRDTATAYQTQESDGRERLATIGGDVS